MAFQSPVLKVRIYNIDHTMVEPGPFDNSNLRRVPVLRVYGVSSTGEKACVHIHQVYPYFFVEYTGKIDYSSVNNYITCLTRSLNHALALAFRRNPASPSSQFVRAILLVKGVHFYGFHSSYTPFLKIYLIDPTCLSRAATVMRSGGVMKTRFCVYESHISFLLQFMCDFGLYGCGWIDLSEVWKRGDNQDQDKESPFKASPHPLQSRMQLEVDIVACHILNRRLLTARNIHHKLTIPAPPLPAEPLVLSVRELWEDERCRRRARGLNPTPEIPVDPSENSRGTGGEWVAEARWWDEIRKRIEREREQEEQLPTKDWEKWVPTTFESVDGLWEDEFKVWKPTTEDDDPPDTSQTISNPFSTPSGLASLEKHNDMVEKQEADVDERLLCSQAMTQQFDDEDAEWGKLIGGDIILDEDVAEYEDLFIEDDVAPSDDGLSFADRQKPLRNDLDLQHTPINRRVTSSLKRTLPSHDDQGNISGYSPPISIKSKTTPIPNSRLRSSGRPAASKQINPLVLPISSTGHGPAGDSLRNSVEEDVFGGVQNPVEVSAPNSTDNGILRPTKRRRLGPRDSPNVRFSTPASSLRASSFSFPRITQSVDLGSPFLTVHMATTSSQGYIYAHIPPSASELLSTVDDFGIPNKIYQNPYYSNESDAPDHSKEYAGLLFIIQRGRGLSTLKEWDDGSSHWKGQRCTAQFAIAGLAGWEYTGCPPSVRETKRWLKDEAAQRHERKNRLTASSQIEGPTQTNLYGWGTTPTGPSDIVNREKQNMTVLALEIFAPSRPGFVSNPGIDEIAAVFYSFQGTQDTVAHNLPDLHQTRGVVVVENEQLNPCRLRDFQLDSAPSELELLNRIVDLVVDLDPDIIVGWETQSASWGYLDARGKYYGYDIGQLISRAPGKPRSVGSDEYSATHTTTFTVIGRHVLNVWRVMRAEQKLETYTFENTAFHLLRQRVPLYPCSVLTAWYQSQNPFHTTRVLKYMMERTVMVLQMLDASETITKTAEFARVFGVDFYSVISRGSQFKVESFMFRIAKPESFVLLSPSKQDVGKQNAAECMPLIMEPQSDFYNGPLLVLDFQSLYPSIMIAYNYCYSTCLGRVADFMGQNKFGVTELQQPVGLLATVKDYINVAPNGIIYVKPGVRKGLLGRMLTELLETRVMVKQAMKGVKGDKALRRVLDARQLGLKYISNVTYGYTSATFSGRMPAVEIADSIVQSGRETLEKAIGIIESTPKWGAKVVYGDTDSLFIYLRGKSKDQAFRIGYDISDTVTAMNPAPIKLKFEKVYLPCVLLAKKRYVGFKYENPDDKEPVFDAKGIETVRRDGVLAQRKMTETCLKILFRTQDLSKVKEYCYASWSKILANKAPIRDFIFGKEVRLGTYSDKVAPPPGAMVASRRMATDSNNEPQYGDRVAYVIARGEPNSKLIDRAVAPDELFDDRHKQIDGVYYITRVLIPPLERIFNLVGADIRAWYDEMPRTVRADQADRGSTPMSPKNTRAESLGPLGEKPKIDDHFRSSQCLICKAITCDGICDACRSNPQNTIVDLLNRVQRIEKRLQDTHRICTSCTGSNDAETVECLSLDCPWLFARKKAEGKTDFVVSLRELISEMEIQSTVEDGDGIRML